MPVAARRDRNFGPARGTVWCGVGGNACTATGVKALQAGNARQAAKLFTTELEAPDISLEERARAFYLRAKAYYAIRQPALAIADIGAALWFKKLSPKDAADAERLKAEAQRSAAVDIGLPDVTPVTSSPSPPAAAPASAPPPPPAQPAAQKPLAPEEAASSPPPVRQPLPNWSTAAIKAEQLPPPPVIPVEPAKPISPWTTSAPVAAPPPPVPQRIETSSVARPDQSSAPNAPTASAPPSQQIIMNAPEQVATATPQPPASPPPNTRAQPSLSTTVTGLVPNLSSLGSLFAPEPSPMLGEVDQANDLQRRHYEKIRQYNRDAQAANAAQSANGTQASDNAAPALPGPR
jgi:hypothetical protein